MTSPSTFGNDEGSVSNPKGLSGDITLTLHGTPTLRWLLRRQPAQRKATTADAGRQRRSPRETGSVATRERQEQTSRAPCQQRARSLQNSESSSADGHAAAVSSGSNSQTRTFRLFTLQISHIRTFHPSSSSAAESEPPPSKVSNIRTTDEVAMTTLERTFGGGMGMWYG